MRALFQLLKRLIQLIKGDVLKVLETSLVDRCPHRSEIQSIALAETKSEKLFLSTLNIYCCSLLRVSCFGSSFSFLVIAKKLCGENIENTENCMECMKPTIYNMCRQLLQCLIT